MKLNFPCPAKLRRAIRVDLITQLRWYFFGGLFFLWLNFISPTKVLAAQNQEPCQRSSSCVVGEFLYDDSYVPITTATCTLNVKDPDGNAYITNQSLTAQSDGWYAHNFTPISSATLGLYRGQICCTSGSDYMCLDKSFQLNDVPATALTAAEVWSYSSRSLTSFGNLISDIWGYATRTITGGVDTGSLSTKTDITNLANLLLGTGLTSVTTTTTDITTTEDLSAQLTEIRNQLETIVNKPVIDTTVDEGELSFDLDSKLKQSEEYAASYRQQTQTIATRLAQIDRGWSILPTGDIVTQITQLFATLGTTNDKNNETLGSFGNWLKLAWDNRLTQNIHSTTNETITKLQELSGELEFFGKSSTAKGLITQLKQSLAGINTLIGLETSVPPTTLYGYLKDIRASDQKLAETDSQLNKLITEWFAIEPEERQSRLDELIATVNQLNQLPQTQVLGASTTRDDKQLRNLAFNLKAVIQLNRRHLAADAGKPLKTLWLEDGSVVFKAQITNPSPYISQTIPLKFYLPKEISEEDILSLDEGLEVTFDPSEDSYYAHGSFVLPPSSSKILKIETQDIFEISSMELETYRNQAKELAKPLERTSYFGQGVLLQTDINTSLDKIALNQEEKSKLTPEGRIKQYRESELELLGVKEKLVQMQVLVSQADSARSVFGFVGGVQSIAVWGLILVTIAGFVFLTIYMRSITLAGRHPNKTNISLFNLPSLNQKRPRVTHRRPTRVAHFIFLLMTSASLSALSLGAGFQLYRSTHLSLVSPIDSSILGTATKIQITPSELTKLELKELPQSSSKTIYSLDHSVTVTILSQENTWSQIQFEDGQHTVQGWIKSEYLKAE